MPVILVWMSLYVNKLQNKLIKHVRGGTVNYAGQ